MKVENVESERFRIKPPFCFLFYTSNLSLSFSIGKVDMTITRWHNCHSRSPESKALAISSISCYRIFFSFLYYNVLTALSSANQFYRQWTTKSMLSNCKSVNLDPRLQPSPLSALIPWNILPSALSLGIKQLETTSVPPKTTGITQNSQAWAFLSWLTYFFLGKKKTIIFFHNFSVLLMYPGALCSSSWCSKRYPFLLRIVINYFIMANSSLIW